MRFFHQEMFLGAEGRGLLATARFPWIRGSPPEISDAFGRNQLGEMLKRPVVSALGMVRKTAARQQSHVQMVLQAFTAYPFSGTGIVGAIAGSCISFLVAFHKILLQASIPNITVSGF